MVGRVTGSRSLLGYALMVVTAVGWAGAWLTARAAAHDAPPLSVTTGRFIVAVIALVPVWLLLERGKGFRPTGREWLLLAAMSATGTIGYTVLFLTGIQFAPASDGAVITPGLAGVSAMLISALVYRTVPPPRALLGAALAVSGCALVGWASLAASAEDPDRIVGDLLFVACAVVWGIYTVIGKRAAVRISAVTSILLVSTIGALALAPVAFAIDGTPDLGAWGPTAIFNVVYLGVVATAVAFVTFYAAVKILGVDRTAPALGLVPVFGVLGAALLLDEVLTPLHALGGLLVVLGIVLPNLRALKRAPAPPG